MYCDTRDNRQKPTRTQPPGQKPPRTIEIEFVQGTFVRNFCIVLYCIVSIHLYSAACSAHQSEALPVRETQREKRAVLRERKEALGSPVNKVDRVEGRSWFQSEGPMIAKARV